MLNARAETIAEKPSYRVAFQRRRCLIPSDGFYEWRKVSKQKLPVHFRMRDNRLFAFAGLWERWLSPEGVPLAELHDSHDGSERTRRASSRSNAGDPRPVTVRR